MAQNKDNTQNEIGMPNTWHISGFESTWMLQAGEIFFKEVGERKKTGGKRRKRSISEKRGENVEKTSPAIRKFVHLCCPHQRRSKANERQTDGHRIGWRTKARKGSSTASISLFISSLRILFSLSQRSSWAATSSASNRVFST